MTVIRVAGLVGLGLLLSERRAEAFYLDPTTGSIAYQVAIGGLLAATAAVRMYWGKIRAALRMVTRGGRTDGGKP
ncbi:MAG: hypothetical protein IPJ98_29970 [Bryobacterales bacterium]|nr:hypothetical protein [Bryobacterales bacterium]